MDGLRERVDVGVEGIDDEEYDDEKCSPEGYDSLNLVAARMGEDEEDVGVLLEAPKGGLVLWWRGDVGRRRERGKV